jgi:hypothetical protein
MNITCGNDYNYLRDYHDQNSINYEARQIGD